MRFSKRNSNIYENSLGMVYYKFLINFSLFAGAVINLIFGIYYISGEIYAVVLNEKITATEVYAFYGNELKVIDVLYGLFLTTSAIYSFVVRQRLANFKANAPGSLTILCTLSTFIPFLYSIICFKFTEQPLNTSLISSFIGSLVTLLINIVYFKKRAHLFSEKSMSTKNSADNSLSTLMDNKYNPTELHVTSTTIKPKKILYCSKCGTKLADNSIYCHNCGSKIL